MIAKLFAQKSLISIVAATVCFENVAMSQNSALNSFVAPENIGPNNFSQGNVQPTSGGGQVGNNGLATNDSTLSSDGSSTSMGGMVSLEYNDALLIDTLRHLAETANVNVAFSPSVENTKITLRLNKITHENAMRVIMDLHGLAGIIQNGILRIGSKTELQNERQSLQKARSDNWKLEPTRVLVYQLNYARADKLVGMLNTLMRAYRDADNRLLIQDDKETNKLIIEGVADALARAKMYIEVLDKRKHQVRIEARIVEASNDLTKTLGINWGTRFALDAQRGLSSGLIFPNSIVGSIGGAGSLSSPTLNLGAGGSSSNFGSMGFTLGSINGMINIDGILKAYETENLANIVASPQITVEDLETAKISESQTIARQAAFGAAANDSLINIGLDVTPTVRPDNSISLQVKVQRDTPTNAPTSQVTGSTKRSADTTLVVDNGETAVIGGLYQTLRFKSVGRIPVLGKLPIIGFLFRNTDENTQRSELMVMITPRILPSKGTDNLKSGGGVTNFAPASPGANFGGGNIQSKGNGTVLNSPINTPNNTLNLNESGVGNTSGANNIGAATNIGTRNNSGATNNLGAGSNNLGNAAPPASTNNFGPGNEFGNVNSGSNLSSGNVPSGNTPPANNSGGNGATNLTGAVNSGGSTNAPQRLY